MDELIVWLCVAGFVITFVWGWDRHLCLKEVERSLNDYLGDLLVSKHAAVSKVCECCAQSRILEIKSLIRKHFKL